MYLPVYQIIMCTVRPGPERIMNDLVMRKHHLANSRRYVTRHLLLCWTCWNLEHHGTPGTEHATLVSKKHRVFEQRWFVGDCLTMFNTIHFAFSLLSRSMPSGCCRYCKKRTREYFESFGIQLPRRVMLHLHLGQPSAWMTKLFLFQLGFVVIFSTKLRASWKEVPFEVAETENSCYFLAEDWSKDVHVLSFA